jgi:hypothetical protein
MEEKQAEQVKGRARKAFCRIALRALDKEVLFATERRSLGGVYGMCPPGRFRRDLP